ncbi:ankyrin repeat domain-containing protein [Zarconia navalis]|uniref:ankyrin repeat domain-containing protein n=1 Tax=Zarconia navalis TaxID=2992134 RepID=UPI0021F8DCD5|nr:ankyrin repeat domain-containing protein [Zarconia navalis]
METLGEGGNGITYKAEPLEDNLLENGRYVALKALSLRQMKDWKPLELFEREARILQHLNHPSIPCYLDYFHVDTPENRAFYIVQELVEGQSLAAMVEKGWRTNEAGVRRIAIQVLEILVYLHDLKPPVIHRDIKPQNLMWGKDGNVFLVDFGAVRDTDRSTLARGSTIVGTFGYMAPEQFQGHAVPATDLYGLGATVLFLLTHRSPAELPEERLKISFRSRVQISDSFADWLERAIEPDAGDRFASAREALGLLRGKVVVGKRRSSFPFAILSGIGVAAIAIGIILNHFQYAILDLMRFTPDLCDAASLGNTNLIRGYLDKGGNPNIRLEGDRSLLDCALETDELDLVKLLLDRGADINAKNEQGDSLLHLAFKTKQKKLVKQLIKLGADINLENKDGYIPLHFAMGQKWINIADLLLNSGARLGKNELKSGYYMGYTLLHLAILNSWEEWTKLLIKKGTDVNIKNSQKEGITPLHFATRYSRSDTIDFLIVKGADVNAKSFGLSYYSHSDTMATPLSSLLGFKYGIPTIRMLHGRNSEDFQTELDIPVADRLSAAQLLIDAGADVNFRPYESRTLLHIAVLEKDRIISNFLIENGADVNALDVDGRTPLNLVIEQQYSSSIVDSSQQSENSILDVISLLIANNIDVNLPDKWGFTPIQNAILADRKKVVNFLVLKGAKIDRQNPFGKILLYRALLKNNGFYTNAEIMSQLILGGANVNATDEQGITPLDLAKAMDSKTIIFMLQNYGAIDSGLCKNMGYPIYHGKEYTGKIKVVCHGKKSVLEFTLNNHNLN